MIKRAGMAIAIAAVSAGFASGTAAGAAEPTTCDQVRTVLISDQSAATADAKLVKKRAAAVTKAKAAAKLVKTRTAAVTKAKAAAKKVGKSKKASKARKKLAAKRVTTAQKALKRAQAKQTKDASTLTGHQELSSTLCTPGY